jgi:hypothetical protein
MKIQQHMDLEVYKKAFNTIEEISERRDLFTH